MALPKFNLTHFKRPDNCDVDEWLEYVAEVSAEDSGLEAPEPADDYEAVKFYSHGNDDGTRHDAHYPKGVVTDESGTAFFYDVEDASHPSEYPDPLAQEVAEMLSRNPEKDRKLEFRDQSYLTKRMPFQIIRTPIPKDAPRQKLRE